MEATNAGHDDVALPRQWVPTVALRVFQLVLAGVVVGALLTGREDELAVLWVTLVEAGPAWWVGFTALALLVLSVMACPSLLSHPVTTIRWLRCRTLEEYGATTARYLRGEMPESPTHGGAIFDETLELVPALVHMNERGLVTTCSQPTRIFKRGAGGQVIAGQKAFIWAFGDPVTVRRVANACRDAGLSVRVVTAWRGGDIEFGAEPQDIRDGRPHRAVALGVREACCYSPWKYRPAMRKALRQAHGLSVYDPHWDTPGLLWRTVCDALDERS